MYACMLEWDGRMVQLKMRLKEMLPWSKGARGWAGKEGKEFPRWAGFEMVCHVATPTPSNSLVEQIIPIISYHIFKQYLLVVQVILHHGRRRNVRCSW